MFVLFSFVRNVDDDYSLKSIYTRKIFLFDIDQIYT